MVRRAQGRRPKKLLAAARHWARGGKEDLGAVDDAAAFGAPPEVLDLIRQRIPPTEFEVWPENWLIVTTFLDVSTQWHLAPSGSVLGLKYDCLEAAMRMKGIKYPAPVFEGVREMESVAVKLINKTDGGDGA